jgi:hypothetical protein
VCPSWCLILGEMTEAKVRALSEKWTEREWGLKPLQNLINQFSFILTTFVYTLLDFYSIVTHFRIQNSPSQIQDSHFQHPPPRLTKRRCRKLTTHHRPLLLLSHPLDHSFPPPPRSSQHPLDYLLGQSLRPRPSSVTTHQHFLPQAPLMEETPSGNHPG